MSIKLMSAVWENGPQNKTELIVLLALADHSNDEGLSWPSVKRIAAKSRLKTDRGAQKVLRQLEADGWIEITTGGGRSGCNIYKINPEHLFTPNICSPRTNEPKPRTNGAETPNKCSPEPLEPSKEPSVSNTCAIREALEAWASPEAVASFLEYRRNHKSKALTLTGAKRLSNHLQQIFNAGFDPSDALGMAEERGWASVQPDWYLKSKGENNGKSTNRQGKAGMAGDPALEQIARLAGLR